MRYFLLAAHATRRTPRPHRGLFKRLCLLNAQVLALCACLEMQGIKRCFGERDHISWSQEFRSPNRVINAARLFDSCSYTTALPVAKSSQSQSCILQNTLPNVCFFLLFFFSAKAASLPHENNAKPQLLLHKHKQKTNMLALHIKISYLCLLITYTHILYTSNCINMQPVKELQDAQHLQTHS